MDIQTLRARFSLPGLLQFEQHHGLTRLNITTPQAEATLYLQGAHLTHWRPTGQEPVLFLSSTTDLAPGKPIRGGIPLAFPWFAADSKQDRIDGKPGPSHGFARIEEWSLVSATHAEEVLQLRLTLQPTDLSRSLGYPAFSLALEVSVGATLGLQLTITNTGTEPLHFEEAFHTYFAVDDVVQTTITGLEGTPFIDKIAGFARQPGAAAPLQLTGPTDRIYENTAAPLTVHDPLKRRLILVEKTGSDTTVVWNPWKALPDLSADDWPHMVCVETVNAAANARILAAGESASMGTTLRVTA